MAIKRRNRSENNYLANSKMNTFQSWDGKSVGDILDEHEILGMGKCTSDGVRKDTGEAFTATNFIVKMKNGNAIFYISKGLSDKPSLLDDVDTLENLVFRVNRVKGANDTHETDPADYSGALQISLGKPGGLSIEGYESLVETEAAVLVK